MRNAGTLWDNAYAPVTSRIGFLRAPIKETSEGLHAWRRKIYGSAELLPLAGGLWDNLTRLEPLTLGVRPRELLVATANPEWTAYFDCGAGGADPVGPTSYLAQTMRVQGLAISSRPHDPTGRGPYASTQFELFAPIKTHFMNYVRTISVTQDGKKWRFDANGTIQDYEDAQAYTRRRVKDRFTPAMLADYAHALGLEPFDENFYPGPSVLITTPATTGPGEEYSIREAQDQPWIPRRP